MASTDFLTLTNKVLRRLNEVELTSSTFAGARGIHATAKDAVLDAIEEMNKVAWEWPFNALEHTETLVAGTEEYSWPTVVSFKAVDWDSFQIQKDDVLGIKSKWLKPTNKSLWYKYLKNNDDDHADGVKIPDYIFPTHGTKYGVSPSPNEAYSLKFRYYQNPIAPELYSDTSTIPEEFDYVIFQGALYHMYTHLDNQARADKAEAKFYDGIKDMRRLLIPEDFAVTAGVMNPGGGVGYSSGFYFGER